MEDRIKFIHDSLYYGSIVETGCSTALSTALLNEPNASKTVYNVRIPYDKLAGERAYGTNHQRSVSAQFIAEILNKESELFTLDERINFIYASSWQMNTGDEMEYTHGWVGVKVKNNSSSIVHFSFDRERMVGLNRKEIIALIAEQCVNFLYAKLFNETSVDIISPAVLDVALHENLGWISVDYDTVYNTLKTCKKDYFLCFSPFAHKPAMSDYEESMRKGSPVGMIRFEEIMRINDKFIIQKGSFNPLHHKHVEMMTRTHQLHSDTVKLFLISINLYDKPAIALNDLVKRIEFIVSKGYTVIVCKSIFFYETFDLIKQWTMLSNSRKFYFPIGIDTINRIVQADIDYCTKKDYNRIEYVDEVIDDYHNQFKFIVFPREGYSIIPEVEIYEPILEHIKDFNSEGVSSTKIRDQQIENKV